MRKGVIEHSVIIRMILSLIFLMVGIGFLTIVATGKGGEIVGKLSALFSGLDCDSNVGTVSFKDFMKDVVEASYENCQNDDCGNNVCATIDLGEPAGTAYIVGPEVLSNWKLDDYNNVNFLGYSNIYCNKEDADIGDNEIDAFYSPASNYDIEDFPGLGLAGQYIETKQDPKKRVCGDFSMASTGRFVIPQGAKVIVTAKKHDNEWLTLESVPFIGAPSVDLKVNIKYSGIVDTLKPVNLDTCTTDDDCNDKKDPSLPKWGYCDTGGTNLCKTMLYCKRYPAKCKEISVTCVWKEKNGACTPANVITDCKGSNVLQQNDFKTKTIRVLTDQYTHKANSVSLELINPDGEAGQDYAELEKEKWYGESSYPGYPVWFYSSSDPDAKMSYLVSMIEPTPNTDEYKITLLQGCY